MNFGAATCPPFLYRDWLLSAPATVAAYLSAPITIATSSFILTGSPTCIWLQNLCLGTREVESPRGMLTQATAPRLSLEVCVPPSSVPPLESCPGSQDSPVGMSGLLLDSEAEVGPKYPPFREAAACWGEGPLHRRGLSRSAGQRPH